MPQETLWQVLSLWGWRSAGLLLVGSLAFAVLRTRRRLVSHLFRWGLIDPEREPALGGMLASVLRWVVWLVSIPATLSILGADIWQLLTGAGLVGVALGLGAQNVVRDMIAGFFIMVEDQYRPGDYVQINGEIEGMVESLDLRMTRVRGWDGTLLCVGNASIARVKNYNRDLMRVIIEVSVPFEEDHARVHRVIEALCARMARTHREHFLAEDGQLVEPPFLYGITNIDSSRGVGATYCIMAVTRVESYWYIAREMRRLLVEWFRHYGIRLSYPHRIYLRSAPGRRDT